MSAPFSVAETLRFTGGRLLRGDPDARLTGVSIDSRQVGKGELFVAIRGPVHDAHAYLAQAVEAGAGALLVETGRALPGGLSPALPVVAVTDTTRGLGALAAGHRAGFDGPVVAITGSNGKTTTKEMCAAILAERGPCLKTRGNLNNEYGLPLTLLAREPEHRALVVEIGMNHRGEIAPLARIARPTVGVLTNVGTAHIEHLGSREAIAEEKGDLLAALDASGTAVVNEDDPLARAQAARTPARVVRFGLAREAEVRAEQVRADDAGHVFTLVTPKGRSEVRVPGLSATNVPNALAAAAAALGAGAELEQVRAGLGRFEAVAGRMQRRALPGGAVCIDDTYNANPQSLAAALRALVDHRGGGRAVAVLGDMGELGAASEAAHHEAGALAARLGVSELFAVGEHAPAVAAGAREAGLADDRVHAARDAEEVVAPLREALGPGDWLLVKGSRAMRMERVVRALSEESA